MRWWKTQKRSNNQVINEEAQIEILRTFIVKPTNYLGTIAEQTGISLMKKS